MNLRKKTGRAIRRLGYLYEHSRDSIFRQNNIDFNNLKRLRLGKLVEITHPVVLISQIPRSGGTLLSQLFDGHPQIYAHPLELHFGATRGSGKNRRWPNLELNTNADLWFDQLVEERFIRFSKEGYRKGKKRFYDILDSYPFVFLPNLQKEIFFQQISKQEIASQREILNCYMTSFFNAWIDYQGLYLSNKKYITAFLPQVSPRVDIFSDKIKGDLDRFFKHYPDGKLLSIIRDPKAWYVSSIRFELKHANDLGSWVALWKEAATLILANKEKYGDQIYLLHFESLILETEETMHKLSNYLDIKFTESLLTPTFQGMDIRANSFEKQKTGIINAPLKRADDLTEVESAYIHKETQELYEAVLSAIG